MLARVKLHLASGTELTEIVNDEHLNDAEVDSVEDLVESVTTKRKTAGWARVGETYVHTASVAAIEIDYLED